MRLEAAVFALAVKLTEDREDAGLASTLEVALKIWSFEIGFECMRPWCHGLFCSRPPLPLRFATQAHNGKVESFRSREVCKAQHT